MKRILTTVLTFLLLFTLSSSLIACKKEVEITDEAVIIRVDISKVEEGATLKDYMDYLNREGKLSYEASSGMVLSINGKSGNASTYWMLYTSDTQNSNAQWGSCVYEGETYYSASLGFEQLVVKDGELYIWTLQSMAL